MRPGITLLLATGLLAAAPIPSGTEIQIRLTSALNTASGKAGQHFDAVVIAPVVVAGRIAMAAGAKVSGHIVSVTAADDKDQQASLSLAFDQIAGDAQKATLAAKVSGIDNARETVASDGLITGIKPSDTGSARLDQGINKVSQKYPGFGDLLSTVKDAVLKKTDANIDYEPGVEMTIALTKALNWTASSSGPNVKAIQPEDALAQLVAREPFRTMAQKPAKPSDVINLMFIASEQQLESAFEKAGWSRADRLNGTSKLETFRAMAEDRGYSEAPVSILYLDGAPPDIVFEKSTDTFNARHHIRIFHRPDKFNGQEVWEAASTHDTGIDFSQESHSFTHKIDPQIDHERAKVVNDLLFTGLVQGLSLVERNLPPGLSNATGDQLQTDGSIAVLSF
ncbi:MAG TPA: LssY C-terminal domain-containing protein [Bryobacteraceae bacterium]|nr:LssY C-terminal domain-containing protein [Bryobacteraceae bacterium]